MHWECGMHDGNAGSSSPRHSSAAHTRLAMAAPHGCNSPLTTGLARRSSCPRSSAEYKLGILRRQRIHFKQLSKMTLQGHARRHPYFCSLICIRNIATMLSDKIIIWAMIRKPLKYSACSCSGQFLNFIPWNQCDFTLTSGNGIPVTEETSMNFFRSWCRNSKTK